MRIEEWAVLEIQGAKFWISPLPNPRLAGLQAFPPLFFTLMRHQIVQELRCNHPSCSMVIRLTLEGHRVVF